MGSYEGLWVCSASMFLAAAGLLVDSPNCVGAALVAVSTGHILWSADSFFMVYGNSYAMYKNYMNGNANARLPGWSSDAGLFAIADYNSVDGRHVSFGSVYVSSHHLWFIPLCIWWMRGREYKLSLKHLLYSIVWVLFVSGLTVLVVPLGCVDIVLPHETVCIDLNVNMVKRWWGMEGVYFFHVLDRDKGTHVALFYLYANFIHDVLLNGYWWILIRLATNGLDDDPIGDEEATKMAAEKTTKLKKT